MIVHSNIKDFNLISINFIYNFVDGFKRKFKKIFIKRRN